MVRIDDVIARLEEYRNEYGNIPVFISEHYFMNDRSISLLKTEVSNNYSTLDDMVDSDASKEDLKRLFETDNHKVVIISSGSMLYYI